MLKETVISMISKAFSPQNTLFLPCYNDIVPYII